MGPCNSDGDTGGNDSRPASGDESAEEPPIPEGSLDIHPPVLRTFHGWKFDEHMGGFYRYATVNERDRHSWAAPTVLVAWPVSPIAEGVSIVLPAVRSSPKHSVVSNDTISTIELHFQELQKLTLGNFVEHRGTADGTTHEFSNPMFTYFVTPDLGEDRGTLLRSSDGSFLIRAEGEDASIVATGPHEAVALHPPPPDGYVVVAVENVLQGITRLMVHYSCENGTCDDPDDPLDECNDGVDNDGDGVRDLCDWNCLPHADFGADKFPLAASRAEAGKTYAIMGHGSYCTLHPDTWEIELADAALNASDLLNGLRPDLARPIRYRTFSCWVFESLEAYQLCQFGPFVIADDEPIYDPPECPQGMDYPYAPTETDQMSNADQSKLTFEEALVRVWSDLEYNVEALGATAEPANGVIMVTHDLITMCYATEHPNCPEAAGRSILPDADEIYRRGTGVASDQNLSGLWPTLAHETAHTIGLVHDDRPGGIMDIPAGTIGALGTSIDPQYPNLDNNVRWESGLTGSKGLDPRSPGFFLTGCDGLVDCAPLGKPGWSCTGIFCVEGE